MYEENWAFIFAIIIIITFLMISENLITIGQETYKLFKKTINNLRNQLINLIGQ